MNISNISNLTLGEVCSPLPGWACHPGIVAFSIVSTFATIYFLNQCFTKPAPKAPDLKERDLAVRPPQAQTAPPSSRTAPLYSSFTTTT